MANGSSPTIQYGDGRQCIQMKQAGQSVRSRAKKNGHRLVEVPQPTSSSTWSWYEIIHDEASTNEVKQLSEDNLSKFVVSLIVRGTRGTRKAIIEKQPASSLEASVVSRLMAEMAIQILQKCRGNTGRCINTPAVTNQCKIPGFYIGEAGTYFICIIFLLSVFPIKCQYKY